MMTDGMCGGGWGERGSFPFVVAAAAAAAAVAAAGPLFVFVATTVAATP